MKVAMTERHFRNPETGEESWSSPWDTNMDSLKEAVEFAETIDHYVVSAFVDWATSPAWSWPAGTRSACSSGTTVTESGSKSSLGSRWHGDQQLVEDHRR